jgi:hypothetical protein
MHDSGLRIAMWSGPRNISTALLRSWGNRPDTFVCDEPLYAHYLIKTDSVHPGAAEVVAHHETSWRVVVDWLTGEIPEGKSIFYQKHMAHHLLPHIDRGWLERVTNCFLIRDPGEMLLSLVHFLPKPTLEDTGLPQQVEIFQAVKNRTGVTPPVIDSRDVLQNPAGVLGRLCAALDITFLESMLSWPRGRRATDGIWAKHWYAAVEKSTGFQSYIPKKETVPGQLAGLLDRCQPLYEELYRHRLVAPAS